MGGACLGARVMRVCALAILAAHIAACRSAPPSSSQQSRVAPFGFQVALGQNQYQIEGYLARSDEPGRLPALLVLNGAAGGAERCIAKEGYLTAIGMQVACISIPGYGASSGPSRFVGPQAVAAARRALDLLAARPDVDSRRLGVWGFANGAVAAGLTMDSDPRLKVVVLESGAYDMLSFWPEAAWTTKLAILREVWPSRRILSKRSVIAHLPRKLGCRVLILHGERDRRMPVLQARELERALRDRGTHVEAHYFPREQHILGASVEAPLKDFLRENLIAIN
jgi:dipeptidyl aminopeptidase/acylaminoacyl peptidase